jgi:hypothetical protein
MAEPATSPDATHAVPVPLDLYEAEAAHDRISGQANAPYMPY